jgi:hypothetical protein
MDVARLLQQSWLSSSHSFKLPNSRLQSSAYCRHRELIAQLLLQIRSGLKRSYRRHRELIVQLLFQIRAGLKRCDALPFGLPFNNSLSFVSLNWYRPRSKTSVLENLFSSCPTLLSDFTLLFDSLQTSGWPGWWKRPEGSICLGVRRRRFLSKSETTLPE